MEGIKMKRYKLLKNTPIAPKGEIFGEYVRNGDTYLMWLDKNGAERSTDFRKATILNFDEWFKEIKEFKEWKPKEREVYKYISLFGRIDSEHFAVGNGVDKFRLSVGNCYPTNTPDDLIIKERKLIPQALHRLKMAVKKAWFKFNESEGPDWSDLNANKYCIHYDFSDKTFDTYLVQSYGYISEIYFPTKESAQWVIDNMRDDLKLVMEIE